MDGRRNIRVGRIAPASRPACPWHQQNCWKKGRCRAREGTMSLIASARTRIALIVPRLGSNHTGEIVASAAAIGRSLQSAGADWHDLANAIRSPGQDSRQHECPPTWQSMSPSSRYAWLTPILDRAGLSEWEHKFATDMLGRARLSEKQEAIVDRLFARAFGQGVRP
jgi:hypothetical protein